MIDIDISKNAVANLERIQEALSHPIVMQHLQELRINNLIWLTISNLVLIISLFLFLAFLNRAAKCDDSVKRIDYIAGCFFSSIICIISLITTVGNTAHMVSLNNRSDLHAANFIRTFK